MRATNAPLLNGHRHQGCCEMKHTTKPHPKRSIPSYAPFNAQLGIAELNVTFAKRNTHSLKVMNVTTFVLPPRGKRAVLGVLCLILRRQTVFFSLQCPGRRPSGEGISGGR